MNELQIFNNPEFSSVRVVAVGDEPWWCGKDICDLFGDTNHNRSLGRIDDGDKRRIEVVDALGRAQTAVFINEAGVYALLFAMQPQKANNDGVSDAYPIEVQARIEKLRRFKRWVTSEVLPAIRKHGMYATDEVIEKTLTNPDFGIRLLTELKREREQRVAAQAEAEQLTAKVEKDAPKVLFADAVAASKNSILVGQLAKLITQNGCEIGQNRLYTWLRENGYLCKCPVSSNYNLPMQRYMNSGLFEVKVSTSVNPDGSIRTNKTTKVTGKGQLYFINKFLSNREEMK